MTINLALSARRRAAVAARVNLRLVRADVVSGAQSSQPQPFERDPKLWSAVAQLSHQQRAAIALHYLEDRPVAEIAELMGCTASTARVHLHRGRAAIARTLGASS